MEKRALLAALLSAMFLAWYSQLLTKGSGRPAQATQTAGQAPATQPPEIQAISQPPGVARREAILDLMEHEEVISIESEQLKLEIGASSAAIRRATLKDSAGATKKESLAFAGGLPLYSASLPGENLSWKPLKISGDAVTLGAVDSAKNNYHISYAINSSNPLISIELTETFADSSAAKADLVVLQSWSKADKLSDQYNRLEAILLSKDQKGKSSYKRFYSPWKTEKTVPRGTSIVSLAERYFCFSFIPTTEAKSISLVPTANGTIAVEALIPFESGSAGALKSAARLYLGPRDYFYLKQAGIENAIPIGAIGQLGLMLLVVLNWIASITKNYGVAIILFSGLITCAMAPFTLLGVRSMKKMQELKPKIDKIMAQHKGDPARANKEVFELYKAHRVSPMSGCLPMLLQIPVFIALFQALSHFVAIRGETFLWIQDLSLPDRLAQLPFSLPILGNELNALPIIMAVAMYVQTRMSQPSVATAEANPTAKLMSSPVMSIIFGVMFYQFPSCLVLYWLTNSLTSLVWYKLAT